MLILSRKDGETIKIGNAIEVVLIHGGTEHAKIGIEAPKSVPIIREDALDKRPRSDSGNRCPCCGFLTGEGE